MSSTPYSNIASTDILSAHINGLASSVNKLEQVLNMKTTTVTGHTLNAVNDMGDLEARYRIYEGSIRNWTTFIVKRNGVTVPSSEYDSYGGFGAIVFKAQQQASDVITIDATYITNQSQTVEDIYRPIAVPYLAPKTTWLANFKDAALTLTAASDVTQAAGTIDAFPFFVFEKMTLDRMKFVVSKTNTVACNMIAGIYTNKNSFPDQLLASTSVIPVTAGDTVNHATVDQSLQSEVVVNPGLYWVARYQSGGLKLEGNNMDNFINILDPEDTTLINGTGTIKCVGARTANLGSLSSLPTTFPALTANAASSGAQYLKRSTFGTVWTRRKS